MSEQFVPEAFFDDALAAAGFAEMEASELRVKLREVTEGMIACKLAAWRWHETLLPMFQRLRKFHQISQYELDFYATSQVEDRETIERDIENFRAVYGAHPMYDGKPMGFTS